MDARELGNDVSVEGTALPCGSCGSEERRECPIEGTTDTPDSNWTGISKRLSPVAERPTVQAASAVDSMATSAARSSGSWKRVSTCVSAAPSLALVCALRGAGRARVGPAFDFAMAARGKGSCTGRMSTSGSPSAMSRIWSVSSASSASSSTASALSSSTHDSSGSAASFGSSASPSKTIGSGSPAPMPVAPARCFSSLLVLE